MTDGMMGQLTGTYFEGASCPILAGEGVFALKPWPTLQDSADVSVEALEPALAIVYERSAIPTFQYTS